MLKYIGFKVIALIPIIWSTYILRPTFFPEFPVRLILCVIIYNLGVKIIRNMANEHAIYSHIVNDPEYRYFTESTFLPSFKIFKYLKISFKNYSSIIHLVQKYDVFKGVVDCILILAFLTVLDGNPFINNYIGFVEPVGLAEDETGNPNKPILYKSVDYERLNDKNLFDYYSDYEITTRRRTFIFEETAVLNDFPRLFKKSKKDYLELVKIYLIGICTSLVESIIKSLIWVTLFYLLFFLFDKSKKQALEIFFKREYIEGATYY